MTRKLSYILTACALLSFSSCHYSTIYQIVSKHEAESEIVSETVYKLLAESAGIAIVFIVLAYMLAQLLYRMEKGKWNGFWKALERKLSLLFLATWVLGFCTYCVGMFIGDGNVDVWSWDGLQRLIRVAPMGIIHAFEMFLLESDVSAIHDGFHENLFFMTCFSIVHFLAALVSLMFVIKHFGYNIVARVHLWLASVSNVRTERFYIFWGMNEPSYHLAKDINNQAKNGNATSSYRTLFIKTTDNDDDTGNRAGLDRMFDFLSIKNKELDKLKELDCLSTTAFNRLSKCELSEIDRNDGCHIIRNMLGLRRVAKLINKTTAELHIFMLSENEDNNIEAASNICHDKDIMTFAANNGKVHIYCHARYDSINRVVEDAQSNGNIEVRIVDSAHDSINELRSTEKYHPIHFVDIDAEDNIGTVKSPFTCMVVGFGETGQDAARFLYEFGAFVSNSSTKEDDIPQHDNAGNHICRSTFKCHIIDSRMDAVKGRFIASAPALGNEPMLEFHSFDINSEGFYDLLNDNRKTLNYVVVSLKDDELSITTAVRIFKFIRKSRKDLSKFKIFVRCNNSVYEQHMRSIAEHYNQVFAKEHKEECIVIYGCISTIYTYNQIIKNEFEEEGKEYNHAYCEASGNNGKKDVWETRHTHFLNMNTLDGYSELRRKETQDMANAYHALTKTAIMKAVSEKRPEDLPNLKRILSGDTRFIPTFRRNSVRGEKVSGTIHAEGDYTEAEQLLFRNIARLEHLRWNASHEVLGYRHFNENADIDDLVEKKDRHKCNERHKVHNCILDWEQIDTESDLAFWEDNTKPGCKAYPDYKLYDFIVITTTLKLYANKKLNK